MVICQKDLGMIPEGRPSYPNPYQSKTPSLSSSTRSRNNNNNNNRNRYDDGGSGESSSRSCLVLPFSKKKKKKALVVSSSAASTADQSSTADHIFSSSSALDDRRGLLDSANRLTTNALDWYANDDGDDDDEDEEDIFASPPITTSRQQQRQQHQRQHSQQQHKQPQQLQHQQEQTPPPPPAATKHRQQQDYPQRYVSAPQFIPPSPQEKSPNVSQEAASLLSFPTPTDRSHGARRRAAKKHAYDGELEPEGIRGQEAEVSLPMVSPEPSVAIRTFFQDTSPSRSSNSVNVTSMDQSTSSSQDIQAMLRPDFLKETPPPPHAAKETLKPLLTPESFESPGRQFLKSDPVILSSTHTPKRNQNALNMANRSITSESTETTTQQEIHKNNLAEFSQQERQTPQKVNTTSTPISTRTPANAAIKPISPPKSASPSETNSRRPHPATPSAASLAQSSVITSSPPSAAATSISSRKSFRKSAPVNVDDSSFEDPVENVSGIHAMAMEHVMRGEYDMALQAFSQVLKVYLDQYGRAHPLTASAYHNLGTVHSKRAGLLLDHTLHQRHCREQALLCFQAAARSARDCPQLGPAHPNVAVSLVRIGFLLLQSRQYQNAVITFQEALRIRIEHYGSTHGLVANLYNNLGVCHMHLQDFKIGRRYLQQALDIQKQLLAQDEFSTTSLLELADTLCNIGGLCLEWIRQQGPDSRHALDAESAFLEALEVRTKVLGENHALTNQVRSLHDMVRSIPLPKLSPRSKSSSANTTSGGSSVASSRARSLRSPGTSPAVSPRQSPGRPYATSSTPSLSPRQQQQHQQQHTSSSTKSQSQSSGSSSSTSFTTPQRRSQTPEGLNLPTLENTSNVPPRRPSQRLSPPSPITLMRNGEPDSHATTDLSSIFTVSTSRSIQMDRTVQSELGSSVFTSTDDLECYDASEESCLLQGDDLASTVVSYARTASSWNKSTFGSNKTPDRMDCLLQAKAILNAHKDYLDSSEAALIQEATDYKSVASSSRNDLINEDGLAPLGGVWPSPTSERITQETLQDPYKHLHTIQNCAAKNLRRGRYGEALHLLELVLECQREKNGMLHEDVGAALHNVGIAQLRMENYYKALQSFEEAVRVRKGALGRDHPHVAVSLVKVGISLLLLKRLEDSLWIFREALTVRKHGLGALHPSTARIYNNIGCVHVEFQELKEARRAFEAALDIQRNALVNEPENGTILFGAATTLQNLGYLYQKRGMQEKAILVLKEALTLQEKVLGDNHPTVLANLDRLAELSATANLGTAALKHYNELLERLYEEATFDKLQESRILHKMAKVHKQNHDVNAQIGKLQLAMKVVRSVPMNKERDDLEQEIQKDLLQARQKLEKEELEWV